MSVDVRRAGEVCLGYVLSAREFELLCCFGSEVRSKCLR